MYRPKLIPHANLERVGHYVHSVEWYKYITNNLIFGRIFLKRSLLMRWLLALVNSKLKRLWSSIRQWTKKSNYFFHFEWHTRKFNVTYIFNNAFFPLCFFDMHIKILLPKFLGTYRRSEYIFTHILAIPDIYSLFNIPFIQLTSILKDLVLVLLFKCHSCLEFVSFF